MKRFYGKLGTAKAVLPLNKCMPRICAFFFKIHECFVTDSQAAGWEGEKSVPRRGERNVL